MRSYRRLALFAPVLLIGLFGIGLLGELPPRREFFPFASWFLFAKVPSRVTDYDVEFRSADDQPLDPPRRFSRAAGWVIQPHSIATFNVIQSLGAALEKGQGDRVQLLRRQFDASCGPQRLEYAVVRVRYDPVARYQTGVVLERKVLGTFVAREP